MKAEIFDMAVFIPPPRWKKGVKDGLVSFSKIKEETYCAISVHAGKSGSGDAHEDFMREWDELAVRPFGIGDQPVIDRSRRDMVIGTVQGTISKSGCHRITLVTFNSYNKVVSVVITYNDDNYKKEIDKFLGSFGLVKAEGRLVQGALISRGNDSG